ncbi:ubiquitin-protein ligase e3b-like [Plakobranchus ocellatus]|uniref:HECT-type E3 ubiquitin transferase n=1 Tax=Plakobranchus ocellatus TaxID=259542 RepID=A0AAV4B284_9GAST|nr:ubiquitin-protein ligase e3b-like [Plakobranchus ocellatus]
MVMCRLRVGHTWLTESYILKNEEEPFRYACDSLHTVRHILIECPDFQITRGRYFSVTDLYRLFQEVNPSRIVGLAYNETLLPILWRFLCDLGPHCGLKTFIELLTQAPNSTIDPIFSLLSLFCETASHMITTLDDMEMLEQQKIFSVPDYVRMSEFLNLFIFKVIWNNLISIDHALNCQVYNSCLTLLMILHERDSRHSFTPANHWLIREVKPSTFISELEKEKGTALFLLQKVPHIIPFNERVIIFRKNVIREKEALGLTESACASVQSSRFTIHHITVHRSRIIEDGYRQLAQLPVRALKGFIRVKFINEMVFSKLSLAELFEQLPKPFLVLGDFNMYSPACGDSHRDGQGRMLKEFTAENDLIILNSGEQTFVHSAYHSTSAIDLAVASPSIAVECSWAAHNDLCGSDHFPIFLTLTSNFSPNVNTTSFNFQKADWSRFGDLSRLSLDDSLADIEQFTSKLLDAARSSIPFHKGTKCKTRVPWFTQECRQAHRERKKAQRKYFKAPSFENFINFKKQKAEAKFVIKTYKKQSWKTYVSSLNSNTSSKTVWKKKRKIKGKNCAPSCHLKKDGRIISDFKDHADYLAETFKKLLLKKLF